MVTRGQLDYLANSKQVGGVLLVYTISVYATSICYLLIGIAYYLYVVGQFSSPRPHRVVNAPSRKGCVVNGQITKARTK